ncbi:hypothetical protein TNCV_868351 [Trichonephila clavipes]|nr:hypothetical protein TNCV_868351 [Trichonephila clavipes]
MGDAMRRLAATKIPFITVQQGYEFRNDVYADRRSFSLDFFVKRSPHLPHSFSLWTLYPIASSLPPILYHLTVALNVLSLIYLVLFYLDISAKMHLSQAIRFCCEIKFHDDYSLLLEKIDAPAIVLN